MIVPEDEDDEIAGELDDPDDWRSDADDPETCLNEKLDAEGAPDF